MFSFFFLIRNIKGQRKFAKHLLHSQGEGWLTSFLYKNMCYGAHHPLYHPYNLPSYFIGKKNLEEISLKLLIIGQDNIWMSQVTRHKWKTPRVRQLAAVTLCRNALTLKITLTKKKQQEQTTNVRLPFYVTFEKQTNKKKSVSDNINFNLNLVLKL